MRRISETDRDLVRDVLDTQLVARGGARIGKVDDIVLRVSSEGAEVVAISGSTSTSTSRPLPETGPAGSRFLMQSRGLKPPRY